MDFYEREDIAEELIENDALFRAFWDVHGEVEFTDSIPTAAITFASGVPSKFLFNKDFWDSLDHYNRSFIIAHEMLHIFYNHGSRIMNFDNPEIANIAADLVVNHSLINIFNFDRNKITDWEKYIWVDTIFEDKSLPLNLTLEQYYKILSGSELPEEIPSTLDSHMFGGGDSNDEDNEDKQEDTNPSDILDQEALKELEGDLIKEVLSNSELKKEDIEDFKEKVNEHLDKNLSNGKIAGSGYTNDVWVAPKEKVKEKKSWTDFFFKFVKVKPGPDIDEQWAMKSRRMFFLGDDMFIPAEYEVEKKEEKMRIGLFLDVSVSCTHLKKDFWKAAKSIPKKHFEIDAYTFSTITYEVDLDSNYIPGGGGTDFQCIEDQLILNEKNGKKYPDAVVVITDGESRKPKTKLPEKWFFFLDDSRYSTEYGIPKGGHAHRLSEVK